MRKGEGGGQRKGRGGGASEGGLCFFPLRHRDRGIGNATGSDLGKGRDICTGNGHIYPPSYRYAQMQRRSMGECNATGTGLCAGLGTLEAGTVAVAGTGLIVGIYQGTGTGIDTETGFFLVSVLP